MITPPSVRVKEKRTKQDWSIHIGSSNFEEFVTQEGLFVDKTKLIQVFIQKFTKCTLLTRPRRWGKTLNMSMLHYFFSPPLKEDGNLDEQKLQEKKDIFSKLKMGTHLEIIEEYLGQYPTIFISFKDVKATTYEGLKSKLMALIAQVYRSHRYVLHSPRIQSDQKLSFKDS